MDEIRHPELHEAPRPIPGGGDPRRLYAVIGVLLGVIAVLAIRPWGDATGPLPAAEVRPSSGHVAVPTRTPGLTDTPDGSPAGALDGGLVEAVPGASYAGLWVTCGSPSGWRAATLQEWAGRATPIRSWIAIDPVPASGPLDPAIPFAPVATDVVTAIGYCSPIAEDLRPPETARGRLWAVGAAGARPLTAVPLEPATPNALGGLWRPAPEVASGTGGRAWPPGRYVVEVSSPGGFDRWLGVEIIDLRSRRAPSPSPSASAGASAAASPAGSSAP